MIKSNKIVLRDKSLADAQNDYTWQVDPELAQLDAAPPLATPFPQYLLDYASELRYSSPTRRRFAIETLDSKHIGNCTYYNINETKAEAELGIMIGNREYWDKGYGADAVSTLVNYIFQKTNLQRIYLKTLETNHRAQSCFKKCGFIPCGYLSKDGYNFVLMKIRRNQWEEQQKETQ